MLVGDGPSLGGGQTGKVHQAGHVDAGEHVGLGVENVVEFQRAHLARDVGKRHGKRAAEAAALFLLSERDDLGVLDG